MATFLIQQKITVLANQYRIYKDSKQPGNMVAFAQQKRIALKEKFTFYTDETKQKIAFHMQARKVIDLGSAYDVQDESGATLGIVKKQFRASLFRSTWTVHAPGAEDTPLLVIEERSIPLAILRRVWSFAPFIGDLPFLLKYHFDFIDPKTQKVVGVYNKTELIRDHYQLTIQDEYLEACDWHTLIAAGVVMDALQER